MGRPPSLNLRWRDIYIPRSRYRTTLNFMVMENIFHTEGGGVVKPNTVYDIKGSWVDRNAAGTRSHKPESGTFKDQVLRNAPRLLLLSFSTPSLSNPSEKKTDGFQQDRLGTNVKRTEH